MAGTAASRPLACDAGDSYYATDTKIAYVCNPQNTWIIGAAAASWSALTLSGTNTGTGMVLAPTSTMTVPYTLNCPAGITVACVNFNSNPGGNIGIDVNGNPTITVPSFNYSTYGMGSLFSTIIAGGQGNQANNVSGPYQWVVPSIASNDDVPFWRLVTTGSTNMDCRLRIDGDGYIVLYGRYTASCALALVLPTKSFDQIIISNSNNTAHTDFLISGSAAHTSGAQVMTVQTPSLVTALNIDDNANTTIRNVTLKGSAALFADGQQAAFVPQASCAFSPSCTTANYNLWASTLGSLICTTGASGSCMPNTVYNAAGTVQNSGVTHIVQDTITLAAGTAIVTLTAPAAFASATSFTCTANDQTAKNPVQVVQTSGTSLTFNGTTTDVVRFICIGN